MPQALTRIAPDLLPVPYSRPLAPAPLPGRADEFRVDPLRAEILPPNRYGGANDKTGNASNATAFTAQRMAHEDRLQLARTKPVTGYAAYTATSQQTGPDRSRPGQKLDVSI